MSGRIKLTPEELRTSAVKYSSGSEEVLAILNSLTNEQAVIRDNWEGTAFESFDRQFHELSPKIREFANLLVDIHQQMHRVADIIETTDREIASQIG